MKPSIFDFRPIRLALLITLGMGAASVAQEVLPQNPQTTPGGADVKPAAAHSAKAGTINIQVQKALADKLPEKGLNNLADLGAKLTEAQIPQALEIASGLPQLRERAWFSRKPF